MNDPTTREPLNALAQVLLTHAARARLNVAAARRHLTASALHRAIVMEWLDNNEPAGVKS